MSELVEAPRTAHPGVLTLFVEGHQIPEVVRYPITALQAIYGLTNFNYYLRCSELSLSLALFALPMSETSGMTFSVNLK